MKGRGETGKGKVKGKGKQKGKGKDKDKPVTEVSQEDSQSWNNSQIVASFTSDWIFAVTWETSRGRNSPGQRCIRPRVQPRVRQPQSSSSKVGHWSGAQRRWQRDTDSRTKTSSFSTGGQIASVELQVRNVKRCIFSIGCLIEQLQNLFRETGPQRTRWRQAQKHRHGRLYHLRAQLLETERATQVNPVWVDEQGNEKEMNEHGVDNENAHTVGEQMDVQTAKSVREPRQPTEKELSEHSLTHAPFRSWCKACVLAQLLASSLFVLMFFYLNVSCLLFFPKPGSSIQQAVLL